MGADQPVQRIRAGEVVTPATSTAPVATLLLPRARAILPFLLVTRQDHMATTVTRFIVRLENVVTIYAADDVARALWLLTMCERQIETWGNA